MSYHLSLDNSVKTLRKIINTLNWGFISIHGCTIIKTDIIIGNFLSVLIKPEEWNHFVFDN